MRTSYPHCQFEHLDQLLQIKSTIMESLQYQAKIPHDLSQLFLQQSSLTCSDCQAPTNLFKKLCEKQALCQNTTQQYIKLIQTSMTCFLQTFSVNFEKLGHNSLRLLEFIGHLLNQINQINNQYHTRQDTLSYQLNQLLQNKQKLEDQIKNLNQNLQAKEAELEHYWIQHRMEKQEWANVQLREISCDLELENRELLEEIGRLRASVVQIQETNQNLREECEKIKGCNLQLQEQVIWTQKKIQNIESSNRQLLHENQNIKSLNQYLNELINKNDSTPKSSSTKFLSNSQSRNTIKVYENEDEENRQNRNLLYRVKSIESIQSSAELLNLREQLEIDGGIYFSNRYIDTEIEKISIGVLTELHDLNQEISQSHSIEIPMLQLSDIGNPHKKKQQHKFIQKITDLSVSTYIHNPQSPYKINTSRMSSNNRQFTSRSFIHELVHKRVAKPKINESIAEMESRKNQESFLSKLNSSMTDRMVKKRIRGVNQSKKMGQNQRAVTQSSVFNSFKKILVDKRIKK